MEGRVEPGGVDGVVAVKVPQLARVDGRREVTITIWRATKARSSSQARVGDQKVFNIEFEFLFH